MKNRTLLFGEGLFETFRVYPGRKLTFVDDHLRRMEEGCQFFGLPFSRENAIDALKQRLRQVPEKSSARLRLNLLSHGDRHSERTSFEVSWETLPPSADRGDGARLIMAPFPRFSLSPLVRFKTTSYLENIFVFTWARRQGYFDALFTNERGELTEGSITNIFFVTKDRIVTPPIAAGLLPGITRKHVLQVASRLGISWEQATCRPEDIARYETAFVTNSVIEILTVAGIHDVPFKNSNLSAKAPEVLRTLLEGYRKHRDQHSWAMRSSRTQLV